MNQNDLHFAPVSCVHTQMSMSPIVPTSSMHRCVVLQGRVFGCTDLVEVLGSLPANS